MGRRLFWLVVLAGLAVSLPLVVVRIVRKPSNDRQWHPAQRVLPRAVLKGNLVEIRNVRDFAYRSETDLDARYVTRTYDLRKLDSVWYVVSRFGGVPGLAHSFLTFGFGDEYVAISVEARKEADESYSPVRGLLREYELMYVIGTERDVIGIRTSVWNEAVSLYPVRTSKDKMQRAFIDMTMRAEQLAREPEFYDTITSSCSSNIVSHVNTITPDRVGFSFRTMLPGYSDRVAYELGMIDTELPFEQAREKFRIDTRPPLDDEYSQRIRGRVQE